MKAARLHVLGAVAGLVGVWATVAGGCASEQQRKGQELYAHYCMHCHGENGRQNEGFNWSSMPDPKPKDLSNKEEMGTFKDEELEKHAIVVHGNAPLFVVVGNVQRVAA